MKKILFGSLILGVAMMACDKAHEDVGPSTNKKFLGLVVQTPTTQNTALILLEDGRSIIPQSGFNPPHLNSGSKFLLSFEPISTTGKIINAKITSYVAAIDSAFIPAPSTLDSVAFKSALIGAHRCTFTSAVVDYSQPSDTVKIIKDFNIIFTENTFDCKATYDEPALGGTGTYHFSGDQLDNLIFVNNLQPNPSLPPGALLDGKYYHMVFGNYIAIWTYTNTTYSGFLINR